MSDLESVLAGETPVQAPEPVVEAVAETPEPEPQPVAAEPSAEPTPEPEPEPKSEPHMVPISVVKELRQDLRELKSQLPKPEPVKPPDILENPDGYDAHITQTIQSAVRNERMNMSEHWAREKHGSKVVDAALEALQASGDQAAMQAVQNAAMPYAQLVQWHKQQQVVREVGDDPDGWMKAKTAEIREQVKAEIVAEQLKAQAGTSAPSLANVTSSPGMKSPGWAGPTSLDSILGG